MGIVAKLKSVENLNFLQLKLLVRKMIGLEELIPLDITSRLLITFSEVTMSHVPFL